MFRNHGISSTKLRLAICPHWPTTSTTTSLRDTRESGFETWTATCEGWQCHPDSQVAFIVPGVTHCA